MENHYVTFGQFHVHSINGITIDKNCVVVFKAKNDAEGRKKAFEFFSDMFFTDYHGDVWNDENLKYFPRGYVYL